MRKMISNSVLASEIADLLKKPLHGEDVVVYGPSTFNHIDDHVLVYLASKENLEVAQLADHDEVLVLTDKELGVTFKGSYIVTPEPELDFVKSVNHFFSESITPKIQSSAVIEEGAKLAANVTVMNGCFIGADVEIDSDTVIFHNAVISGKVRIGKNSIIKANSTIGSDIFHFVRGQDGGWVQFPQVGKVVIGDNVWIGANTTIEKGSLSDTIIRDGVKIDDLVQIGSSSVIEADSIVAAGAVICNDVHIGQKCWIAPNASIRENVAIKDGATVGLGAVVLHDVEAKSTVVGNPAKVITH